MTSYMLTGHASSGWRDIQVDGAADIREAIVLAERVTGCMISHGRSGVLPGFHPGVVIDATTGQVDRVHDTPARPQVVAGPADAVRAVAAAMRALASKPRSNVSRD